MRKIPNKTVFLLFLGCLLLGPVLFGMEWGPPLHYAAAEGNEDAVRAQLDAGVAVNDPDNDRMTPMHYAAQAGHAGVVRVLLQAGGDVKAAGPLKDTPLHWARGAEVVRALLDAGAVVDARDANKMTPLHCAAMAGHKGEVRALLDAGADPLVRDSHSRTPLDLAVAREQREQENDDIVRMLHGAMPVERQPWRPVYW